ncbi:MAG: diguanylate cyclase [Deltaproteobacteria bacterium]|jgi:diguanylate cyclase (GGDEF)-like protein/PAS domain S-box-containing protein|nr:diguanylate cyclase [Deltaproteobacteria bacterium]MCL5880397.1 diguanylate cyclase [Deltaproteobacteria bacterium]MDA8303675.1 diguanylate cyclase [Deltaproteobacteria bacterium]
MRFNGLIKSKTFLFGIIILTAYSIIFVIIYNSVVLKMERDMDADNNIQLEVIKLSNSIRLAVDSAQDVVHFSRKNDKKRLKSSLSKLSASIALTNKRFEEFNKNLEKFPYLKKTILPFESRAYYNWKNLTVPILTTLIIHHKIMAKRAFMEPLFISMYKTAPNYAPLMESGFQHRIKDALYFHIILNIIFIAGFFLFFIILTLFIFNISSKELRIQESEKKYRMLFNSIGDAVFLMEYSKEGFPARFIDANKAGLKRLGYDKDEFLKLSPINIIPKADYDKMKNYFRELALKGHLTYEANHITKDGKIIQVEAVDNILDAGTTKMGVCIARDISGRKALEKKLLDSYLKYNNLVEFLPVGVYQATIDKEGHFIDVNDYMVKTLEASGKEELINTKIVDLYVEGGERTNVIKNIMKEGVYEFEGKRRTLKGRIIDVYIACRLKKDDYGKDMIDCILFDITKEKELENRLKESRELFMSVVNSMNEGVFINDTKILYANPAAVECFGYPEKELYDMYVWDLFGEKDKPIIKANIERRLKGEQFYFEYTFHTFTKKGEEKYILFHVQTIVYQGRFVALAIFFDITAKVLSERESEKEKLYFQELSETDHLTGIFNRRKLEKSLGEYVKLALRYNRPLSLIMFDIDHFKAMNDSYGHQIGDNVLIELANLVKNNLRETDFFARFGGEEFIILMPETDLAYAKAKAESLRRLIEKNIFKYIYRLTCSFGVVEYGEKDNLGNTQDIIGSLIKRVDNALYRAKENGRNRVEESL